MATATTPLSKLVETYALCVRMKPENVLSYSDMADDLHRSIKSIMAGADAEQVLVERVRFWRDDARLAGSQVVAAGLTRWADFLEGN